MRKYQNLTFKSIKEAILYKKEFESMYGFKLESPIIKVTSSFIPKIPKGLIIEALDQTENSYVISPLHGFGYYVFLPKKFCKKIC